MNRKKILIVLFFSIFILYIVLSYILLDGRITYYTSFNESTIEASKKENLFVSDNLEIVAIGDSLKNYHNRFEIWTNSRFEIKYWGILFHCTYTKPECRYLNIEFKNKKDYIENNTWCYKLNNEKGLTGCCDRIGCNVGDTIAITFYKCMEESKIGTLRIVVK